MINNFDIDWWAFLLIGLFAGLAIWQALAIASVFAFATRRFSLENRYSPMRAYGSPEAPNFKALPAFRSSR